MTYALQTRRARFISDGVAAASPQTLLVLLADRLVLDLGRAEAAQRAGDLEKANAQLQHAQAIVTELDGALDRDAWDGAKELAALYAWLQKELVTANVTRNADLTAQLRVVVEPLADAWRQAVTGIPSVTTTPAVAATTAARSFGGVA